MKIFNVLVLSVLILVFASCTSVRKAEKTTVKQSDNSKENKTVVTESETGPFWTDESVPSLKETYAGYFDYIGVAVPASLYSMPKAQKGIQKHFSSVTMENEMKPDAILGSSEPTVFHSFEAQDGKTYKVPDIAQNLENVGRYLRIAKELGIKMRGHVMVWHSQTPTWFFMEDYKSKGKLTDKETMTARMEWIIKSELEYVRNWENENYEGSRIITAWDVVNEALGDQGGLRTASNWYAIFRSDEFIVKAFTYATQYAPEDLQLVYNDYCSFGSAQIDTVYGFIDKIREAGARIDVVGIQAHLGSPGDVSSPGLGKVLNAAKKYAAKDVLVQITELDFAGSSPERQAKLADTYYAYFNMFIKNRDIFSGITLWGLKDNSSWIYRGGKNLPLLFDRKYNCKESFFSTIKAANDNRDVE